MSDDRPGEFELIDTYFKALADTSAALGLADDAALLAPAPGDDLVVTADMLAEGVHFLANDPAHSVARKALAVNLSDLAAKGAAPVGYLLSLALPDDWRTDWLEGFAAGLKDEQSRHGISLIGGDTIRASGGVTTAITAIGRVPAGEMVKRSGARPGDRIYVSGTIGDAALGLAIQNGLVTDASAGAGAYLLDRLRHPQPRLALGEALRRCASAALDVSDGLVGDLAHICEASKVGASIDAAAVPLSDAAIELVAAMPELFEPVLTGGDDYEILAAVPENRAAEFERLAVSAGIAVTVIGTVDGAIGAPKVLGRDGRPIDLASSGHVHF